MLSHVWLFCNPMDHSPPGTSVQGILQARILEWVAVSYSRGSSLPRDRTCISCISSVQLSPSVVSDFLWSHGLQHARLPCSSPFPRASSNSILKSVMPFNHLILCRLLLLLPSIFPSIRVFSNESVLLIRWPITGASASASVLSMNIQDWSSLGLIGLNSLLSKRLSRVFSNTKFQKHQFFGIQLFLWSNPHIQTWLLEKQ